MKRGMNLGGYRAALHGAALHGAALHGAALHGAALHATPPIRGKVGGRTHSADVVCI
jgi:uncharacterized protein YjbI with pentapeptide repeats